MTSGGREDIVYYWVEEVIVTGGERMFERPNYQTVGTRDSRKSRVKKGNTYNFDERRWYMWYLQMWRLEVVAKSWP